MGKSNVRIYQRFEWWSVQDCDCEYCLYYRGKKRPCAHESCCCKDVLAEAIRREKAAVNEFLARNGVVSCRG